MSKNRKFAYSFLSAIMILSMALSLAGTSIASASSAPPPNDGLKRGVNSRTGKVSFLSPSTDQPMQASDALGLSPNAVPSSDPALALAKRFGSEFGLDDPATELQVMKTSHPDQNRITVHYQQVYQNIPVMAGELIVNTDQHGDLYSINGKVSPSLSLSTTPTITAQQAQTIAVQGVAQAYKGNASNFTASSASLWIFDENLLDTSTRPPELVWRMDVTALNSKKPVDELALVMHKPASSTFISIRSRPLISQNLPHKLRTLRRPRTIRL